MAGTQMSPGWDGGEVPERVARVTEKAGVPRRRGEGCGGSVAGTPGLPRTSAAVASAGFVMAINRAS